MEDYSKNCESKMLPSLDIRAVRQLMFYTVPEAAALIGKTSEQNWAAYESGEAAMPESIAELFCAILDWRKSTLMGSQTWLKAHGDTNLCLLWYETLDDWNSKL